MLLDLTDEALFDVFRRCQKYLIGIQSCTRLRDVIRRLLPTVETFEFGKGSVGKIFPSLRLMTSLTRLDLSYTEFGAHAAVNLASIMASGAWGQLQVLNLERCKFLVKVKHDSEGATKITFSVIHIIKQLTHLRKLRVLDLRNNQLGADVVDVLAGLIPELTKLEELRLGGCIMAANGVSKILTGICKGANTNLTVIDLSHNSLKYHAKVRLAAALPQLPLLQRLYVDHCEMEFEGVFNLLKALLQHGKNLKELRIGFNRFKISDVPRLENLVAVKPAEMSDEGIKGIRAALHGRLTQERGKDARRSQCAYPGCNDACFQCTHA